jgi:hypothetical protein
VIGLALADRSNEESGPAEVEVLEVERGDPRSSSSGSEYQQQNRPTRMASGVVRGP